MPCCWVGQSEVLLEHIRGATDVRFLSNLQRIILLEVGKILLGDGGSAKVRPLRGCRPSCPAGYCVGDGVADEPLFDHASFRALLSCGLPV